MKLRSVYFSEPMKVFGHMRSNPQDFETCIAHVVKFSQDLISSEMLFPQLRTKFLLKRHPKPQWYKLYRKSSRRWALTDLRFHLMLSLYTSWEKYYGAESASFPVVHGDFGCNVTCQACRENSPRMTISTPRLARTAQTCLGRRLGPQNLTNYTFFYLKPMQLIQYKWYTLMFRCKRSLTILAGTFTVTFTVATYTESVTRTLLWLWVP